MGIFNLCKQTSLNLTKVLRPLQDALKAKILLRGKELVEITQSVWRHVLSNQQKVSLQKHVEGFHLKVDWSRLGMGCILYAEDPKDGVIVGVRSKGAQFDHSSSYLGELTGVIWELKDTKKLVHGNMIVLWTDLESVFRLIIGNLNDKKKLLDICVSNMLR